MLQRVDKSKREIPKGVLGYFQIPQHAAANLSDNVGHPVEPVLKMNAKISVCTHFAALWLSTFGIVLVLYLTHRTGFAEAAVWTV